MSQKMLTIIIANVFDEGDLVRYPGLAACDTIDDLIAAIKKVDGDDNRDVDSLKSLHDECIDAILTKYDDVILLTSYFYDKLNEDEDRYGTVDEDNVLKVASDMAIRLPTPTEAIAEAAKDVVLKTDLW